LASPRSIFAARLAEFPDLVLDDAAAFERHGRWDAFFRRRIGAPFSRRIIFEVGCNDAQFLTRVASKHPDTAFVGVDWKFKAICDAAERVTQLGLRNVSLIRGRAQDVARVFGDGEVDEVWVFHPDPCDKPNELKNRLIAEPFLIDVHRVLRDERSALTLKTDHPGYLQSTLALLGLAEPQSFAAARAGLPPAPGSPRVRAKDLMKPGDVPAASDAVRTRFEPTAVSADFWNDPVAQCHAAERAYGHDRTTFESRFVQKRQPIYYLELGKRA
jgi:tRNA G46 methylase TrmB